MDALRRFLRWLLLFAEAIEQVDQRPGRHDDDWF